MYKRQAMHHPGEVLYTAAEHEAVKNACLEAQTRYGVVAREIPLLSSGTVDLTALEGMLGPDVYKRQDVPDNVAVSEAMEMANRYSEPKSGRYINGVLGAMVRDKQESKA